MINGTNKNLSVMTSGWIKAKSRRDVKLYLVDDVGQEWDKFQTELSSSYSISVTANEVATSHGSKYGRSI